MSSADGCDATSSPGSLASRRARRERPADRRRVPRHPRRRHPRSRRQGPRSEPDSGTARDTTVWRTVSRSRVELTARPTSPSPHLPSGGRGLLEDYDPVRVRLKVPLPPPWIRPNRSDAVADEAVVTQQPVRPVLQILGALDPQLPQFCRPRGPQTRSSRSAWRCRASPGRGCRDAPQDQAHSHRDNVPRRELTSWRPAGPRSRTEVTKIKWLPRGLPWHALCPSAPLAGERSAIRRCA